MQMKEISSISCGAVIYAALKPLFPGGHVRPVLSETDVTLPLVTFRRSNVATIPTRGDLHHDEVEMEFVVFSDDYGGGIAAMERVRTAMMQRLELNVDGWTVTMDCNRVTGGEESWKDGAFVQTLRMVYRVGVHA